MAFNAFNSLTVSDEDETVFVDGRSRDFTAKHIDVAVIAVDDEDRRLQGVVGDPSPPSWRATLDQADMSEGKRPFTAEDHVVVVGAATSVDGTLDLWGGVMHQGVPVLEVPTSTR